MYVGWKPESLNEGHKENQNVYPNMGFKRKKQKLAYSSTLQAYVHVYVQRLTTVKKSYWP